MEIAVQTYLGNYFDINVVRLFSLGKFWGIIVKTSLCVMRDVAAGDATLIEQATSVTEVEASTNFDFSAMKTSEATKKMRRKCSLFPMFL